MAELMVKAGGAVPCPHPNRPSRVIVYPDGGPAMSLCTYCFRVLQTLSEDLQAGRTSELEVRLRMERLGYTAEDCDQFVRDVRALSEVS